MSQQRFASNNKRCVLQDGTMLAYDSVGDDLTESFEEHTFTRAIIWDSGTTNYSHVDTDAALHSIVETHTIVQ